MSLLFHLYPQYTIVIIPVFLYSMAQHGDGSSFPPRGWIDGTVERPVLTIHIPTQPLNERTRPVYEFLLMGMNLANPSVILEYIRENPTLLPDILSLTPAESTAVSLALAQTPSYDPDKAMDISVLFQDAAERLRASAQPPKDKDGPTGDEKH